MGLTQEQLSLKVNVSKGAIRNWEQGLRSPNSTQRKKLAKFFKVSEAEIIANYINIAPVDSSISKVPVISWIHANHFSSVEDIYPLGHSDEWVHTNRQGKHLFALKVMHSCMEPEFKEGEIIIVNPEIQPENGDFVVIKDIDSESATFKQYKVYGDKIILHPLNPKYQDIELDGKKRYKIIGKVVEKVKKY